MNFREALETSVPSCFLSFVAGCLWVSLVLIFGSALFFQEGVNPLAAIFLPVVAFVIGLVPVFLVGIPGYAALLRWGWANWGTVGLLGLLPAVVLLPFANGSFSLFFALYGLPIALVAHALRRNSGKVS